MKMFAKTLLCTATVLAFPLLAQADVVYCTNCSTNAVQSLERATNLQQLSTILKEYDEAIKQTAAQLRMVQQNIEQYANMVQNTISLPQNLLNQVKGEFGKLASLTGQLQTLRGDVTGLSDVFRQVYTARGLMGDLADEEAEVVHAQVDTWSENVDRAAEAAFQASGAQLQGMEQSRLEDHIENLLSTPEGQMQALQAGNSLAAMQIEEMHQLRELVATTTQADLASQMKEEKREQLREEQWRKATDSTSLREALEQTTPATW